MAFQGDSIFWVEVGKIVPNPFQPRKEFSEEKLRELSESIRMYGILQPLTVTRNEIQEDSGAFHTEYELIAGERRLRASKLAGLEQVPVIIRSGEDTEQEKLELAIIENLQREDLNAVDRALAFKQLADVFELSHAQVGKKVGRSREYVSNSIRLLALPECILNSLSLGDISEGHARTLLMLRERPEEQDVVYREILLKKLSVREVERIARKIATDKVRKKKWTNSDAHLIEIEKEFTNTLGTRVQIAKTEFGGKLTIDYFSDDDLQKLLSLMQQQGNTSEVGHNSPQEVERGEFAESQTVIQEMSPEASLLAKLSIATPLEMIEDVPEKQAVPEVENVEESVAVQLEPEFAAAQEEAPEVIVPPVASVASVATAASYLQSQGLNKEEVATVPVVPEVNQTDSSVPDVIENTVLTELDPPFAVEDQVSPDDEFSFITKNAENVLPPVDEPILEQSLAEAIPSLLSEKIEPELAADPSEILAQSAVEGLTEAVAEIEVPTTSSAKDEEESDLYSMKNFSL